jgi:PKD repeat protein
MMIESLFPPRIHMVQATDVVVVSPTRITCTFALPADAKVGTWSVSVTNPDTQVGSLMGFTVTAPVTVTVTPTITTPTGTVTPAPTVTRFPGGSGPPTDPDGNRLYEDVNGNGRGDFADVVLYFNQMAWIPAHEPLAAFDFNANGRIDFADVVWLFNHL